MKHLKPLIIIFVLYFNSFAQSGTLNLELYKTFLADHQDMKTQELLEMYPVSLFKSNAGIDFSGSLYADSVKLKYNLTDYEISLLEKHGFVVTERLNKGTFGEQFSDIYHKDLPVFISTDALLHPFHISYDNLLKEIEIKAIIPKLKQLLLNMNNEMEFLNQKYSGVPEIQKSLKDVDVYLTVPRKLMKINPLPYYPENQQLVDELVNEINSYKVVSRPMFTDSTVRVLDFSQFKPRAHYTDQFYPELEDYFKAMMWFGRIELYLIKPQTFSPPSNEEVQRQTVNAVLVKELLYRNHNFVLFNQIESIIKAFVGEQDNVTVDNLDEILNDIGVTRADELLDDNKFHEFQNNLKAKSFADQKILSHILFRDPMSPDSIKPASAFLLFGQRFVIDSYITGNVVFDKITYKGMPVRRILPNALDMLFPLGNNASLQFLQEELDKYHYATNLAGLRYLVDSYDSTFWYGSIYTSWLNTIRSLNPPEDRTGLPAFMQTAAWWQEKMNTQMAAWSQLRHDNLLYAKQSYTGGIICSFPYSYVEPVPRFYYNLGKTIEVLKEKVEKIDFENETNVVEFLTFFKSVTDTLQNIADKELSNIPFSDGEISFLKRLIYNNPDHMCGAPEYLGWYPRLFYDFSGIEDYFHKKDFVVADYHTAPTDENGNFVGWVKHAGTGPIDLAFVVATLPNGKKVTFTGPVMSFHEITTGDFFRISDEEWTQTYLTQSTRPDWVNLYLADETGNSRGDGPQLLTGIQEEDAKPRIPNEYIVGRNYPNPFNPSTIITFTLPKNSDSRNTVLIIYDSNGEVVKKIIDDKLPGGTYMVRWNGTNKSGNQVSSGIYFYEIRNGSQKFVGKMNLIK